MKIHKQMVQGSWEWMVSRAGKVTGSEIKNLITDKGKIRTGDMPVSYLHRKLAEKWRGSPLESFQGNRQTEQGKIQESQARKYFAALLENDISEIGGIESNDGRLWCSPDGIIETGESCGDCDPCIGGRPDQCAITPVKFTGLEIKCPNADTHVGWLLDGSTVPEEHVLQVQFAMFVTGWETWKFLSYVKDMPHLAVTVEPDTGLSGTIADAVDEFQTRFDAAWTKLCDMNGGPPTPLEKYETSKEPIKFSWEQNQYGDPNDVPTP